MLYLRDKLFKKLPRELAPVAHFEEPIKTADERLILLTNHGKIEIAFYPEVAPRHAKQIIQLARLGVYDGVQFHRIEPGFFVQLGFPESRLGPPLTAEQAAALRRLEAELSDLPMKRWTVAMALRDNSDPDSAVASFFVLLEETRRIDQTYTIVGRVIAGLGTLSKIAKLPLQDGTPIEPAFIEKAEVTTVEEISAKRRGRLKHSGQAKRK
jgi:peptidyl-prolyl cis-trans isomerase B (cyclophilin B)